MKEGYLKIFRKITESDFYLEKRVFSRFEAWFDILMTVNYSDTTVLIGNQLLECKRGQSLLSLGSWGERWRWGTMKVRLFFQFLFNNGSLLVENLKKTTRITVCNYEFYQDLKLSRNTPATRQQHASNTPATTIEERITKNNKRKEKERESPTPFEKISQTAEILETEKPDAEKIATELEAEVLKEKKPAPQKDSLHRGAYTRLQLAWRKAQPELYWTGKEAGALTELIKKLKYSFAAQSGRDPTEDELCAAGEYVFGNIPQWMRERKLTTLPDINSQYNRIISELKNGKPNGKIGFSKQKLRDLIESDYGPQP